MTHDLCKGAEHSLQPYLDRALTEEEVGRIERHLAECNYCSERYGFEAQLRDTMRRCCSAHAPAELVAKLRVTLVQR